MTLTISGHPAATSYEDRHLRTGVVPGTNGIKLTTWAAALPLFLHCAKRLNRKVKPLSARNTWSIGIRQARMASGESDHAGWAIDLWSDDIGAHTWPPRMSAAQAKVVLRIVSSYRTKDGRRIFGWGAHASLGGDYQHTASNDPMHIYVRPGITVADLRECRKRMGIRTNGRNKRRRK